MAILLALTFGLALAQVVEAQGPLGPGIAPFSTITGSQYDSINLASSAITINIPLRSKQGAFPYSSVLTGSSNPFVYPQSSGWSPPYIGAYGWFQFMVNGPYQAATVTSQSVTETCNLSNGSTGTYTLYQNVNLVDATGAPHPLIPAKGFYIDCNQNASPAIGTIFTTQDGTGYTALLTSDAGPAFTIYDRSGNLVSQGDSNQASSLAQNVTTPNGVTLYSEATSNEQVINNETGETFTYTFTDAYGQTFLTSQQGTQQVASGATQPTPTTFSYFDSAGNSDSYGVAYSNVSFATNFQCPSLRDAPALPLYLPTAVTYPDGRALGITYEPTPGVAGTTTGRVQSLQLPNGGSITYSYSGPNNGVYCDTFQQTYVGTAKNVIPILTRTINDGQGNVSVWTYNFGDPSSSNAYPATTVTDPAGNDTRYSFVAGYQTEQQSFMGPAANNNILETVLTCYNGNFTNCSTSLGTDADFPLTVTRRDVYTSYNNGPSSLAETFYNSYGEPTESKQYDYGAAMPPTGTPLSDTVTTYGTWSGSGCVAISPYINDRPCETTVSDASGLLSDTRNTYDGNGNLTQTAKLVSGTTYVTTSSKYNANGSLQSSVDGNGNTTSYTEGACNGLLPTQITKGGLSITQSWDCNGAVMTSMTGPNSGQNTSYTYADPFYRPTQTTNPRMGTTTSCYSDVGGSTCTQSNVANVVTTTITATPSPTEVSTATSDGLGRTINTVSAAGLSTDTTYNAVGQVASVSNPYVTKQDSTYGVTSYSYDAIGRLLDQCQPDNTPIGATTCSPNNSYQSYTYSTNQTTYRNELGNTWLRTMDGLGRLTNVVEPGGLSTTYGYSGLGDLRSATQSGTSTDTARVRSFTYDGLSRLVTANNPESGLVCYGLLSSGSCNGGYDGNGNLKAKTDARGFVTTFSYDALDRLLAKHSVGTQASAAGMSSCFLYDIYGSSPPTNALGRLTAEWTQSSACPQGTTSVPTGALTSKIVTAYNLMGDVLTEQMCTLGSCTSSRVHAQTYTYDLAEHLTGYTDAAGGTNSFMQSYDAGGRLLGLNNSQSPTSLFNVTSFGAAGWTNATMGGTMTLNQTFDVRQRLLTHTVTAGVSQ